MDPAQIAKLITEDQSEYDDLEDDDQFEDEEPGVVYYIVEVYEDQWGMWEENEHYNERTAGYHGPYSEMPMVRDL